MALNGLHLLLQREQRYHSLGKNGEKREASPSSKELQLMFTVGQIFLEPLKNPMRECVLPLPKTETHQPEREPMPPHKV